MTEQQAHPLEIVKPSAAADMDEARIGGKAAGLARLERLKAQVPPWRVIPVEMFLAHLRHPEVEPVVCRGLIEVSELLEGVDEPDAATRARVEALSEAMRDAIHNTPIADGVAASILRAAAKLRGEPGATQAPLAVRSSMVGEDSASHSFAGQLESVLYVRSDADVLEAVRACWMSAVSARVLMYRHRAGHSLTRPRLGVILQQMITGEVSGVAFSANPQTGRRDEVTIAAAWGCGEGIVGGACNTDTLRMTHAGVLLDAQVADKDIAVVPAPGGVGTREREVPQEQRDVCCLRLGQSEALAREVARLADALGAPQDIEWTWAGERLWILQARPITALPAPENQDGPTIVFDNSNIQESYCGVTTPLTFSFASSAYASVYTQTLRVLGLSEEAIRGHEPLLRNMLGLVRGRVYYNLQSWYEGLKILPSFGRNKADMEAMMGVDEPVDFVEDEVLSIWEKLERAPRLMATAARLMWRFERLERDVPRFMEHFEATYRRFDRDQLTSASFSTLMGHLELLRREMLGNWSTPIINDFRVMMAMGKVRRLAERSGVSDPNALINDLMAGEDDIASTEPTYALMRIARRLDTLPEARRVVQERDPDDALRWLAEHAPAIQDAIDDYIERYGDRTMGELKLETVSLREDPGFALKVIRNYLDRPDLDPDKLRRREKSRRRHAEKTLAQGLGLRERLFLSRDLAAARDAVRDRENMRLARTRMFGLFRDVYRAIGLRLHEVGRLDAPRDVFHLTVEEIDAYHEGRAVTTDLAALARLRRAEFAAHVHQEPPHRFATRGPVYHGNRFAPTRQTPIDADAEVLFGLGCYPGVVEAPVRVIMSPQDELSVEGCILTTVRTDPGWAPLFPTARGILVERGSALSHSAVVARELGIPAVVGVPGLLSIVRSGEVVRLDGGTGEVVRLDPQSTEEGA